MNETPLLSAKSSEKSWWNMTKKGLAIAGKIAAVLLVAPFKLPVKIYSVSKCIVLAAEVLKATGSNDG